VVGFRGRERDVGASVVGRGVGSSGGWGGHCHKTIAQAADAIPAVLREIEGAEELAGRYGFAVGVDGSVTDVVRDPGPSDPSPDDRARARQQVVDSISQALRTAGDIDDDLAGVLRKAAGGQFGTGTETTVQGAVADALQESPGEVSSTPPPGGTASQNAAWWTSLSAAGQAILLRDHPDWLGGMDGLPGAVRSRACSRRTTALLPHRHSHFLAPQHFHGRAPLQP
jgi:hypothetical protein